MKRVEARHCIGDWVVRAADELNVELHRLHLHHEVAHRARLAADVAALECRRSLAYSHARRHAMRRGYMCPGESGPMMSRCCSSRAVCSCITRRNSADTGSPIVRSTASKSIFSNSSAVRLGSLNVVVVGSVAVVVVVVVD